jgi:uncharacterized membrane protein
MANLLSHVEYIMFILPFYSTINTISFHSTLFSSLLQALCVHFLLAKFVVKTSQEREIKNYKKLVVYLIKRKNEPPHTKKEPPQSP